MTASETDGVEVERVKLRLREAGERRANVERWPMTRQGRVSYKDLHLGCDRLKIGFWSRSKGICRGKNEALKARCRENFIESV